MTIVTVSPKYQVVIPSELRKALEIHPGHKFEVLAYEGRLEFISVRPAKDLRGILKGIDTSVPRTRGDRF